MFFYLYSKGASSFSEAMRMGAEIYQNLKSVVKKKYGIDGIFLNLSCCYSVPSLFRRKGTPIHVYEEHYDQMCWLPA